MAYDPVADFIAQTGREPSKKELKLLQHLSKEEVDALVSIDNKARVLKANVPARVGAQAY
jgi:hypothetical protein